MCVNCFFCSEFRQNSRSLIQRRRWFGGMKRLLMKLAPVALNNLHPPWTKTDFDKYFFTPILSILHWGICSKTSSEARHEPHGLTINADLLRLAAALVSFTRYPSLCFVSLVLHSLFAIPEHIYVSGDIFSKQIVYWCSLLIRKSLCRCRGWKRWPSSCIQARVFFHSRKKTANKNGEMQLFRGMDRVVCVLEESFVSSVWGGGPVKPQYPVLPFTHCSFKQTINSSHWQKVSLPVVQRSEILLHAWSVLDFCGGGGNYNYLWNRRGVKQVNSLNVLDFPIFWSSTLHSWMKLIFRVLSVFWETSFHK